MGFSERLRAARTQRHLSLRALGELSGFSASFLSQVELGQATPSLGSLQRIADALGVPLTSLLGEETPSKEVSTPEVVRLSARASLRSEWSLATVESLVQPSADESLQAVLLRLDAGGRTGATAYAGGRRLFAYCIRGSAVLALSERDEELTLATGDSVTVNGPRTIAWQNRGTEPVELLVVTVRPA
jgi:transcriptional regulator with XRE-family HTH domain